MVNLFMELNVIMCDLAIPMLPERNVPCNTHNIRCLEVIRDVSGRPTWRPFRCEKVLDALLAESNVILPCYPKLILQSSLCNTKR
jgi:hypothetical protein